MLILMLLLASCHSSKKGVSSSRDFSREMRKPPKADDKYTQALLDEAFSWLGTPYRYGGTTRRGIDCSALIMEVFDSALGVKLPRNSAAQSNFCSDVRKKDIKVGDLVFFNTRGTGAVSHVGLYIGDGRIIHASSSRGVVISGLDEIYFENTYHHIGRVNEYAHLVKKSVKKSKTKVKTEPAANPTPANIVVPDVVPDVEPAPDIIPDAVPVVVAGAVAAAAVALPEDASASAANGAAASDGTQVTNPETRTVGGASGMGPQVIDDPPPQVDANSRGDPAVNPRHKTARHH